MGGPGPAAEPLTGRNPRRPASARVLGLTRRDSRRTPRTAVCSGGSRRGEGYRFAHLLDVDGQVLVHEDVAQADRRQQLVAEVRADETALGREDEGFP